jgi:hypothetical protein
VVDALELHLPASCPIGGVFTGLRAGSHLT